MLKAELNAHNGDIT